MVNILKKINFIIFILFLSFTSFADLNDKFKLVESPNVLEISSQNKKLDINKIEIDDIVNHGIGIKIANKIINYRKNTGGFEKIEELKRIKGIGPATYKKLQKFLRIKTKIRKKPFNINKASSEDMKLYGLNKKDIKKINEYIKKHGRIEYNLELKKILGIDGYKKYNKYIIYDDF